MLEYVSNYLTIGMHLVSDDVMPYLQSFCHICSSLEYSLSFSSGRGKAYEGWQPPSRFCDKSTGTNFFIALCEPNIRRSQTLSHAKLLERQTKSIGSRFQSDLCGFPNRYFKVYVLTWVFVHIEDIF